MPSDSECSPGTCAPHHPDPRSRSPSGLRHPDAPTATHRLLTGPRCGPGMRMRSMGSEKPKGASPRLGTLVLHDRTALRFMRGRVTAASWRMTVDRVDLHAAFVSVCLFINRMDVDAACLVSSSECVRQPHSKPNGLASCSPGVPSEASALLGPARPHHPDPRSRTPSGFRCSDQPGGCASSMASPVTGPRRGPPMQPRNTRPTQERSLRVHSWAA